jgi:prohibitin 2
MNDSQEAFRRFTRQLRVPGAGNKFPGGGGLFAGSGLLFALAAGGLALNSALFNGTHFLGFNP